MFTSGSFYAWVPEKRRMSYICKILSLLINMLTKLNNGRILASFEMILFLQNEAGDQVLS